MKWIIDYTYKGKPKQHETHEATVHQALAAFDRIWYDEPLYIEVLGIRADVPAGTTNSAPEEGPVLITSPAEMEAMLAPGGLADQMRKNENFLLWGQEEPPTKAYLDRQRFERVSKMRTGDGKYEYAGLIMNRSGALALVDYLLYEFGEYVLPSLKTGEPPTASELTVLRRNLPLIMLLDLAVDDGGVNWPKEDKKSEV